ncbi:MAG: hypothetical protein ACREAC_04670, partial [Blastocatellia bacterium]
LYRISRGFAAARKKKEMFSGKVSLRNIRAAKAPENTRRFEWAHPQGGRKLTVCATRCATSRCSGI